MYTFRFLLKRGSFVSIRILTCLKVMISLYFFLFHISLFCSFSHKIHNFKTFMAYIFTYFCFVRLSIPAAFQYDFIFSYFCNLLFLIQLPFPLHLHFYPTFHLITNVFFYKLYLRFLFLLFNFLHFFYIWISSFYFNSHSFFHS